MPTKQDEFNQLLQNVKDRRYQINTILNDSETTLSAYEESELKSAEYALRQVVGHLENIAEVD
jgi:hypothetical protein